jgi:hypothetical protein
MKFVHWLYVIALLTASCDIALFVNVGVATLRLCQILLLLVMIAAAFRIAQTGVLLWPRGGYALMTWCILQGIFVLHSVNPGPSFLFFVLMMLPILGVFAVLQIYGRSVWIQPLLKAYLITFVLVGCFGLFQFVAPSLHIGSPFITQWIIYGRFPRVNGFSYEPSFFATYMMLGWITLVELRSSKAQIVSGPLWFWLTWLVSLALFISTSKTGWMLMIVEGCARLFPGIFRALSFQARRILRGDLRIPLPRPGTVAKVSTGVAAVIVVAFVLLTQVSRVVDLNTFLAGSGLNNTASHSVDKRASDFNLTLQVIRENPWFGVSLGGVAGRVAQLVGDPYNDSAAIKLHWGFPVPVEVFAASGLLGFIPFVWFFIEITWGQRSLLRSNPGDERSNWLRALIRALVFEWLFLSADQNLVRMYFWFHITILMIVAYDLRFDGCRKSAAPQFAATGLVH